MAHELVKLPWGYDALEPHLDKQTMEIHHGKHHQTYVTNLNKALESAPDLASKPLGELLKDLGKVPDSIRTPVRNMGGGVWNHNFYWEGMKPGGGGQPAGKVAEAISGAFGSFDAFKEALTKAAVGQFGSGWGWLVQNKGKLEVVARPNQDCPLSEGMTPLLVVDVWEHAYYLKYQNRRADFVGAWWNVINWDKVAERLG
jgi:Fe-Mn family superoxide dismutase